MQLSQNRFLYLGPQQFREVVNETLEPELVLPQELILQQSDHQPKVLRLPRIAEPNLGVDTRLEYCICLQFAGAMNQQAF